MNNSEQTYESNSLKIAINKYLEKKLINPKINLKAFELNKDEIVWDVVSTIYTQSGYKVPMFFARDIVYQRINDMKYQLKKDEEKAHQEKAYQEMMEIKAEQEKVYQEIIRIKAEEEKAHQEKIRLEKERKITNFIDRLPKELNFDRTKLDIFIIIHKLCCEHYCHYAFDELDEERIFDTELFIKILETEIFEHTLCETETFIPVSNYQHGRPYIWVWGTRGDSCDAEELLMALEEEFDIEIADEEVGKLETQKSVYLKDIVNCIYNKITTL